MNVAMTDAGAFVEVQGTAEAAPFDREISTRCSAWPRAASANSSRCRARARPSARAWRADPERLTALVDRSGRVPHARPRDDARAATTIAGMLAERRSSTTPRSPPTWRPCDATSSGFEREARRHLGDVDAPARDASARCSSISLPSAASRRGASRSPSRPLASSPNSTAACEGARRRRPRTIGFLEYAGGLAALSAESASLYRGCRSAPPRRSTRRTSRRAVDAIVILTSLFTGMVISLESAAQAVQLRRRRPRRRRRCVRLVARARPDALRRRRGRPGRRGDRRRTRLDGRHRADRGARVARPLARSGCSSSRGCVALAHHAPDPDDLCRRRLDRRRHVARAERRAHISHELHLVRAPVHRHSTTSSRACSRPSCSARSSRWSASYQGLGDPRRGGRRRQSDDAARSSSRSS